MCKAGSGGGQPAHDGSDGDIERVSGLAIGRAFDTDQRYRSALRCRQFRYSSKDFVGSEALHGAFLAINLPTIRSR